MQNRVETPALFKAENVLLGIRHEKEGKLRVTYTGWDARLSPIPRSVAARLFAITGHSHPLHPLLRQADSPLLIQAPMQNRVETPPLFKADSVTFEEGKIRVTYAGWDEAADSDEVARAFRDDIARRSDMMPPGVRCLAGG